MINQNVSHTHMKKIQKYNTEIFQTKFVYKLLSISAGMTVKLRAHANLRISMLKNHISIILVY